LALPVRRITGSRKVQICRPNEQLLQDVGFKDAGNAEQVVNEYFNQHFPNAVSGMMQPTMACCLPTAALPAVCPLSTHAPDVTTTHTCRCTLPLKSAASKGDTSAT